MSGIDIIEKITYGLNPEQKKAVLAIEGPTLILAGAGSGKTRVLTHRTAAIIAGGFAAPEQIMAVTFTNKAAQEMEHRVVQLLNQLNIPIYAPLWFSTFHSTCVRILRESIDLLDYDKRFTIYDSSDQLAVLKKVLNTLNINDKVHPAKSFQNRINSLKSDGVSSEDIVKSRDTKRNPLENDLIQVYVRYEEEMKRANALDFADLLLKTYQLFEYYPDILNQYQERFRFFLVDEYQDTNNIQYLLIKKLASKSKNLCVVGDEDQSIYSWRGANISNILNFERDFPGATTLKLQQNYRSTQTIVKAATHLIAHNTERKDKELFTENAIGEKIVWREERSDIDEARFIALDLRKRGYPYNSIAIFYRTNAQSRLLEEQLRLQSIPYRLIGGMKFYERAEIKDILCYMRLSLNSQDDVSFKRVINTPARGIGKTTVEKIEDLSQQQRISMLEASQICIEQKLVHSGAAKKISDFVKLMERLRSVVTHLELSEFYHKILDETQYIERLKVEGTTEADARIGNLEELGSALVQFSAERGEEATLQSFLEEMALVSDIDQSNNDTEAVTLMTLHIAKGLEYPLVYIAGMEEGMFPTTRAIESSQPSAIEEERRLCYVGMTRAREILVLTHARSRRLWGTEQFHPQSRFFNEIPQEYVVKQSAMQQPRILSQAQATISNKANYSNDPFPDYENSADMPLQKGMTVRHPTFGVGKIFGSEGSGDNFKIQVIFQDQSVRKFVAKYARLERVVDSDFF